jgi:regulator of sirC expression with transglutaminase-like and TPR domain
MSFSGSEALIDLLAGRPSSLELDRAALELAKIEYPDLDPQWSIGEIDRHAFVIAERTGDLSDGPKFIETVRTYLFGECGFRGNADDYYHPDNSCINRVLETRQGIPITLSVIYLEVARRLAMPVAGVGLPGHFLVRYDSSDFSAIIDPFHGGVIVDEEQCRALAQTEMLEPDFFSAVDSRHIIFRMIYNLRGIYLSRRDAPKALPILDLLIAANPDSPDEHKQKGVVLLMERRLLESFAEFKRYLTLFPAAPDREQIEKQMRNMAFWMASRN